jgi:predicted  nucleic acid-binding Zn-ribbon protein
MDAHAQYRIDTLHNRIRELERWQEQAREDIARMERCIIALAEPRSTPVDLGEVAAMHGLTHVR